MKLQEVLGETKHLADTDHRHFFINGSVETDPHDGGMVRIYPDASNRRVYRVIKGDDVVGEVHKWTESELSNANIVGQSRYRVALPFGAIVQTIQITIDKIGETLAGDTAEIAPADRFSDCRYASGCGTHSCCSTGAGGRCVCNDCCIA